MKNIQTYSRSFVLAKLCLSNHSNLIQAIKKLENSPFKILFIVDSKDRLMATFTDGDMRRAILKGVKSDSGILEFCNQNPIFIKQGISDNLQEFLIKYSKFKISLIPVLDHHKKIVKVFGFHDNNKFVTPINNRMIIMAGGKGLRLRPYTNNKPKPMVKISNKPILEHIIERARIQGFSNFLIVVNYKGNLIENYFGNGSKFGVKIRYLRESSELGTAGSLRNIKSEKSEDICLINGDVISNINYRDLLEFHIKKKSKLTIVSKEYPFGIPYGVINQKNNLVKKFVEKPIFTYRINAGIYIINSWVLKNLPEKKKFDINELIELILKKSKTVYTYLLNEEWVDIGVEQDLKKANNLMIAQPNDR